MALQDFYNTGGDSFLSVDSLRWAGQIFTASSTYTTDTMRFLMYRGGLPGTVTIILEGESAGKPDGNVLAIGTTDGDTLTTDTAGEWRELTWDTPFEVTSGTKYAVYAKATGTTFALNLKRDVSSPSYAGGTTVTYSAAWAVQSGSDTLFEIYSEPAVFVGLAGAANTVSIATASLLVATQLSGSSDAVSIATASLLVATQLSGSSDAVSVVTGNLGLPISLAASSTATSSATGQLSVARRAIGFYERTANQITTYFQGIADTNSFVVRFDNDPRDTPADDVWYLASVDFGVANQHELGTTSSFRVVGNFSIRSQDAIGTGMGVLLENSDTITTAFRAKNVSRIIFGIPRINNTGRIGDNFQINITCPFMVDKQPTA